MTDLPAYLWEELEELSRCFSWLATRQAWNKGADQDVSLGGLQEKG